MNKKLLFLIFVMFLLVVNSAISDEKLELDCEAALKKEGVKDEIKKNKKELYDYANKPFGDDVENFDLRFSKFIAFKEEVEKHANFLAASHLWMCEVDGQSLKEYYYELYDELKERAKDYKSDFRTDFFKYTDSKINN